MDKKILMTAVMAIGALTCVARPGGPGGFGGGPRPGGMRPGPRPAMHCAPKHHHHHGNAFVGGLVGGIVGSVIGNAITTPPPPPPHREVVVTHSPVVVSPAPVVIQSAPVTTSTRVWVEGCYVDQVQPNGAVLRVWQPGHWEQRTVVVQ